MNAAAKATPRQTQIADLLLDAVEASSAQRTAMLDELRAAAPDIAAEVERLLSYHEAAGDFLLHPPDLPAEEPHARALSAGDILADRFLVEQFLGSGGFGEVYLALDQELSRRVALKTIKPEFASAPQFAAQLKDEIKVAQTVSHPNLCRLYDLDRVELRGAEVVFITMEWISGPTLSKYIKDGAISEPIAHTIANQVLCGLSELHARQVIHRDLKTSNIMIASGVGGAVRAVITDFGLARVQALDPQDTITALKSGWAIGTPAYMAPEQLRGKRASIASDLYAMGVILFEMQARRLPFEGDSPLDSAMARLEREAPSVREFNPAVSKSWDSAIAACLQRDPERRPQSASDVAALLEGRGQKSGRRSFVAVLAASTAAIAAGGYWIQRTRASGHGSTLSRAAQRSMQLGAMFLRDRNKQSLTSAVEEFSAVTKENPLYAPGWAGLAEAYSSLNGFGYMDTRESLRLATEAGKRAVDLDPKDARALAVYARNLSLSVRRWLEAEPYFLRAMRASPDDARLSSWYAAHLGRLSRFDEAIQMLEKGLERHPDDPFLNQQLATEYFRAGKLDRFETASRELVRLFYDKPVSRLMLARALEWTGKFDEAEREIAEADRLGWTLQSLPQKVTLAAARGRLSIARTLAKQAERQWERSEIEAMQMAVVQMVTGDVTKAIRTLNEGVDREDSSVLYGPTSAYFAAIRQTDEFRRFVKRLGLAG